MQDKDKTIANPIYEIKDQQECGLRLHFIKFETKYVETCIDFIRQNVLEKTDNVVKAMKATGQKTLITHSRITDGSPY